MTTPKWVYLFIFVIAFLLGVLVGGLGLISYMLMNSHSGSDPVSPYVILVVLSVLISILSVYVIYRSNNE
jgi:hypothetical protein